MDRKTPVKSLATTFRIVETLVDENGVGISELSAKLNTPKSTVHDHLTSLNKLGYVTKDGETYYGGTRFLYMGTQIQQNFEIYEVAVPELRKLAQEVEEHTSLMIEEDGLGIFLHTSESKNNVKVVSSDGTPTKLHTTAPGKVTLAHLPPQERDAIINQHGLSASTSETLTDRDNLEAELDRIREQGYALDRGEELKGLRGVAAPVVDQNKDEIQAACCVYGPSKRTDIHEFENEILDELLRTVNIIEINLSY